MGYKWKSAQLDRFSRLRQFASTIVSFKTPSQGPGRALILIKEYKQGRRKLPG